MSLRRMGIDVISHVIPRIFRALGFRLLRISSYFFSTVSPYPQKSKLESIDRRDGIDHRAIEGNSPTLVLNKKDTFHFARVNEQILVRIGPTLRIMQIIIGKGER